MADNPTMELKRKIHWLRTSRITEWVLVLWVIFAFVVHWNAQSLNELSFLGFPLGYYFAVQGSLAIFVILIYVQNLLQDRIDDDAGLDQ